MELSWDFIKRTIRKAHPCSRNYLLAEPPTVKSIPHTPAVSGEIRCSMNLPLNTCTRLMCGTVVAHYTIVSFYLTNLILNVKAVLSGVLEVFIFHCVSPLNTGGHRIGLAKTIEEVQFLQGYTFTTTN